MGHSVVVEGNLLDGKLTGPGQYKYTNSYGYDYECEANWLNDE